VKEGKGGGGGDLASGLAGCRAGERLEIRGGANVRGRVGSERRRKGRGLTREPGLAATEKEEKGEGAGLAEVNGTGESRGWAAGDRRAGLLGRSGEKEGKVELGRKGEGVKGFGVCFSFFSNLFQTFQT
jgi:hypothetical protein